MQTSSHNLPGKVIRWIVLGGMCLSLGLQWAVVQGLGWTSMLVSYSQSDGLIQAVSKTFDGLHPCPLCEAVEEASSRTLGKDAEDAKPCLKKFEAVVADTLRIVPPAARRMTYPNLIQKAEAGKHPPPEGPPRARA